MIERRQLTEALRQKEMVYFLDSGFLSLAGGKNWAVIEKFLGLRF